MVAIENEAKSMRWRRAAVSSVLCGLAVLAVVLIVVERNSTSAYPQTITGKFMGFDTTGAAMAFQSSGSANGTSYAWSADTMWESANGAIHDSGAVACLQPSDRRNKITIGVVVVKPQGDMPGTDLIAWVKC